MGENDNIYQFRGSGAPNLAALAFPTPSRAEPIGVQGEPEVLSVI